MRAVTTRSAGEERTFTLSRDHSRRLRTLARLLEVKPAMLHRWFIMWQLELNEDPSSGCLQSMITGLPGSDEYHRRVMANVTAWLAKRRTAA